MNHRNRVVIAALFGIGLASCGGSGPAGPGALTVGVAFETLQSEYWVVSFESIKEELEGRGIKVLEAIADGDANRQLEQVRNFLARGVDGIIIAPKDAKSVVPIIKAANRAKVPIVLYNRPPAETDADAVTIVADNFAIARETVAFLIEQAASAGGAHAAAILIGDLGDQNAVERRRGFDAAIKAPGVDIPVVAEVPTEWNQEKALAGLTNAFQAHPEIDLVFVSSDLLFPAAVSALKSAGRYEKIGEEGHVILGGFDGDATAYRMLKEGYLDADGVQDLAFESEQSVRALLALIAGKPVAPIIKDEGFVIHQGNLDERAPRMWGSSVAR